ncbi:DNA polymerase phi-domain-containing protein [Gymnopilus junonius]|uniref:DNA polymerase phi-domain-containing protein n=1 Tax=Gymnopilus junonius TaxID=109634 RepID=A0A9P5TSS7_GYMJU|nr:DNA polymerase phi-domain-containing protein [Gymnopilus junonius]
MSTTTLPLFWHLSSASKTERIDASVKLVGALEQFQAQFTQKAAPNTSGSDEEEEDEDTSKSDGLDALNAQDVSYSIRRLIRGLASPRESSRLGFAVALTELLSRIDSVTCMQILNIVLESTKHQGSMTGQEERDMLFGRLFGIMAVIQSGLAVRTKPLATSASTSTSASSEESYEQIISQLVDLGEKKSWLREIAWYALSLAVESLHASEASWKQNAVDSTLDLLFVKNTTWSTEKVAIALKLQDFHPQRDWKALLAPTFKNPDLLSSANLPSISRILKESTNDGGGVKDPSKAPSGTWKPQLNFAWDIILDQMLPGPNSETKPKGSFQDFYRVVVDEALFSSTSSPQRKYWGFQVFQKALKKVTEENMPMLFTKNFMRSWINHLSNKDRYLHKIAQQTASEVQTFAECKPQLGFALLLQLTGVNGSQQFDKLTKTKTVESLLSTLDAKGIQSYIDYLLSQIDEPEGSSTEIAATNSRRAWLIEQLATLVRNGKIPKEDEWVLFILSWFVVNGLFVVKKKSSKSALPIHTIPSPIFSDNLRQSCRNRLLACLSDLSSQTVVLKQDDKVTKVTGVASDGEFWISKVLSTIEVLEADERHIELLADVDEDVAAFQAKARETIGKLRKIHGEQSDSAKGAELLLLGSLLEHYCTTVDDENVDSGALEACIEAATRMLLSGSKTKKKGKQPSEEPSDEPVDILVDTVIGFLEKPTAYMRTVGNQVFSWLSGSAKASTIDLIIAQLERRDPSDLLVDDEEMDTEATGNEEEEEEEEEDADLRSAEESDGSQVDDEDSGQDSDDEEVDLELRNKIEEALRVNGIEPATGDTDSEEEELMDDDQMMAIDEQLAQVFRSRASERKSGKNVDAQREATHFKNRVLDLVDTYLKKQPSNPLALRFITPLLDIMIGSSQDERQLSDKARGILRSRFARLKDVPTAVDMEELSSLATTLHTQARKAHSSETLSILSLCNVYLAKIFLHLKAEASLVKLYKESLSNFLTRKNSSLNSQFFQDFIRRFPSLSWPLGRDLLDLCRKSVNAYRQGQVFQLLELLLGLLPSMNEKDEDVIEFMSLLRQLLLDLAKGSCSENAKLTSQQMKELFKLALLAIKQTKRISPTSVQSIWEPQSWKDLHELLKTSRFKASPALKMCEQLVRLLETSEDAEGQQATSKPTTSKRKANEAKNLEVEAGAKPKKRKKVKADKINHD